MSENDFKQHQGQSVKICPANEAVTNTKSKSCALSLFLQKEDMRETCQRIITVQQPSPVLRRLGSLVVYFSPEEQTAHLRCRGPGAWTTTHLVLHGPGMLQGAQSCQISLGDLQLYAEIRGSSQFDAPSEPLIISPQVPVTSDGELQALRNVLNTGGIDQLLAKVKAHKLEANIADLVNLDPLSTTQTVTSTHWTTPLLVITIVVVILVVVYYCTRTHGKVLFKCCTRKESHGSTLDPVQAGSSPPILPSSKPTVPKDCPSTSDAQSHFAMYATQNN